MICSTINNSCHTPVSQSHAFVHHNYVIKTEINQRLIFLLKRLIAINSSDDLQH